MTTTTPDFDIRRLDATEYESAVPLLFSSGPEAFTWLYGNGDKLRAMSFLANSFTRDDTALSHNNIWGVISEGSVIATFILASKASAEALAGPGITQVFRYYGFSAALACSWRGIRLERSLPAPKPDCLHLSGIAVDAQFRGRGLLREIVNFADQKAYEMACSNLSLDVAKSNALAMAMYLHLGFVHQYSRPAPHKSVPGFHYLTRMVLDRDEE
ncbi:GNAT family N-acetyltransferase [Umboniibacter marinipuniceus]|uniref:Acetyltransferase (GNAT) family protein n=1 Tax=Umboniibacter marinipuniceus TaxID=569599 RepID=A0A3M0AFF6_9GAMM|nr:GNAT family N-acetyltransferase [Umboniibacter marinipuniceus]RMA82329.1 acetyltransferase (GNAT) family protein [Umboniibacter marinipuniceus]